MGTVESLLHGIPLVTGDHLTEVLLTTTLGILHLNVSFLFSQKLFLQYEFLGLLTNFSGRTLSTVSWKLKLGTYVYSSASTMIIRYEKKIKGELQTMLWDHNQIMAVYEFDGYVSNDEVNFSCNSCNAKKKKSVVSWTITVPFLISEDHICKPSNLRDCTIFKTTDGICHVKSHLHPNLEQHVGRNPYRPEGLACLPLTFLISQ